MESISQRYNLPGDAENDKKITHSIHRKRYRIGDWLRWGTIGAILFAAGFLAAGFENQLIGPYNSRQSVTQVVAHTGFRWAGPFRVPASS